MIAAQKICVRAFVDLFRQTQDELFILQVPFTGDGAFYMAVMGHDWLPMG